MWVPNGIHRHVSASFLPIECLFPMDTLPSLYLKTFRRNERFQKPNLIQTIDPILGNRPPFSFLCCSLKSHPASKTFELLVCCRPWGRERCSDRASSWRNTTVQTTIPPTFKWIPHKTKLLETIYLFLRKRSSQDFLFLSTLRNDPILVRFVVSFSNAQRGAAAEFPLEGTPLLIISIPLQV